ncbi:MAG: iron ABC transporter permease [Myxococcales bacterium]|nr:iron ABC transporter permease [Myxococcales bacterium]
MWRTSRVAAVLAVLLLVAALVSATTGALAVPLSRALGLLFLEPLGLASVTASETERTVLFTLRAPRIVLAALVGAALGSSGAGVQALFRNPLADPGLVGVSAGASLGAATAIVLGGGALAAAPPWARQALLPLAAFAGGIATTWLVLKLGTGLRGRAATVTVLLAGVAVNALVGAFVGLLSQIADDGQLRDLVFWTMGGLDGASWPLVAATAPWVLLAILALPRAGRTLDLLALGEQEAGYLGVDVRRVRAVVVGAVAIGVGASVAAAGLIGFVGLVVPHLARLAVGSKNKSVIVISALGGATLLVGADAAARFVVRPSELPVGLFTAALGAPFFLWLLGRETRAA